MLLLTLIAGVLCIIVFLISLFTKNPVIILYGFISLILGLFILIPEQTTNMLNYIGNLRAW